MQLSSTTPSTSALLHVDQTSCLLACVPSIQCCSWPRTALHPAVASAPGTVPIMQPSTPAPKNLTPKMVNWCPCSAHWAAVLLMLVGYWEKRGLFFASPSSQLLWPSVLLPSSGIINPPPCRLSLPCLIHSPNVCSSFKSHFKSPIPQELSSSSLSPQPKCSTLLFPTPKLQIRSDKNIRF